MYMNLGLKVYGKHKNIYGNKINLHAYTYMSITQELIRSHPYFLNI